MKVGILTAGGDCPGLNAAIRGVGKTLLLKYNAKVYGISSGFLGLIENDYVELTEGSLSGILTLGGTILGTSREKPFKKSKNFLDEIDKPALIKENYDNLGLDCLVCIGGNGTQRTASKLAEYGMNVIGMPKTIDNDVYGTDLTFGFHSAVDIATEAIDRLHTTANAHKRVMVIELMGHNAGWLTLHAGVAGGGDVILIPEIPYDLNVIADYLRDRTAKKKNSSIIVVAEGIETKKGMSAGHYIASQVGEMVDEQMRETVLGYIQRGGSPSPLDRILATRFGSYAANLIAQGNFAQMVAIQNDHVTSIPLSDTEGKLKLVPKEYPLIQRAADLGTCFGASL
ncbi:MAG: 6-phosphofructokinase [Cyclobacteriaceae bacterium]|nr:6-phosphofructokinase [Cyclobacteriaceae bacterium]